MLNSKTVFKLSVWLSNKINLNTKILLLKAGISARFIFCYENKTTLPFNSIVFWTNA